MAGGVNLLFWLGIGLGLRAHQCPGAAPCVRLTGVVQDYASQQPLTAQLYVKTQTGRYGVGRSADKTGQFVADVTCTAVALIIEKAGYRPQTLLLRPSAFTLKDKVASLVIPLIAIDKEGTDRPYFQTEQTHFVQASGPQKNARPQHGTFVISDALTGKSLPAQACFFFTKTSQKNCLETNNAGRLSLDFAQKDIVALEITAPGYQTYQGQLVVEQLDGRQLQHTIRLTRELTLLSVRLDGPASSCELRTENKAEKSITLVPVPGQTTTVVAYDLTPQRYNLVLFDRQRNIVEQRPITIQSGLNVVSTAGPPTDTPSLVDGPPATVRIRPDSLPIIYFEQGGYLLSAVAKEILTQVATYLTQHPELNVRLIGHTDREGNEQINRSLSEFRAKVTATFLSQRGVTDERIELIGHGSRYPVAASDSEVSKARNRRVHVKFITRQTP